MTKNDRYIVRSGRTGMFLTINGKRVHALDRAVFERAVNAANNQMSSSDKQAKAGKPPLPRIRSVTDGQPA